MTMEYTSVPYTTHLSETLDLLKNPGLLLVAAGKDGRPNAMTIGWGTVGIIWGKPIYTVLVRYSRFTFQVLGEADSFTVCVPAPQHYDAVNFCGIESGRDYDKFEECNLTSLPSATVSAPGIAGCPLIYECKIVHLNDVIPEQLDAGIKASSYPRGDYHRIYNGEILALRTLPNAVDLLQT